VGAYRLENVRFNRSYQLTKVPGFDVNGLPHGKLDRISVDVVEERRRQTRDTIQNKIDYMMNDAPVPERIDLVRQRFGGKRYREVVSNSTHYFFLNHRVPPFNSKAVRQAVSFAVDKRALARLFGGLLEPSCNFLPPGMKGYEEIKPCPYGNSRHARDVDRATALIRQAGAAGKKVTVYGADGESKPIVAYMVDVLNRIGLRAKARIVKGSVYATTIANDPKVQIGATDWFQDFPHPSNFMFLVDGKSIQARNNQNLGFVDDDVINSLLERANKNPNIDEVSSDYAAADRRLVDGAHLIAYGHRKRTVFMSERMNFTDECVIVHPVYNVDFTRLCLK
jgi:peptide/nickel transport system substrate-binding protein